MPATTANVRRVLFVDDDAQFLETIKGLMTAFSGGLWDVSTADSPSSAFGVLQEQAVDMIVVDVQMGVMDGVQMLSLLNRGYPNVQKVVLTGFANEKYRAACLSNGAELFLEKPTNEKGWENLFTVLDELTKFKPEEGFRGVLRRVGIQDVLQMECLARSSSILEIANAQTSGQIYVENGQIIHAQIGDSAGEEAFNRLMGFSGGQFNVKPFKEPPTRSISGPWEFLLMEAARKRDEALEMQSAAAAPVPPGPEAMELATISPPPPEVVAPSEEFVEAPVAEEPLATESIVQVAVPPPIPTAEPKNVRPQVEEFLICSPEGEVMHQWQCRHPDVWVSFFEFLSQRAQRIEQLLPLGDFERLEVQSNDSRMVVIISVDKGVMVRTRQVPAA